MKSTKGQGIIIEIMMFGTAIILSIAIFALLTFGGYERSNQVTMEADLNLEGINLVASTDMILHNNVESTDHLASINHDYQGKTFYELLSIYYSVDEEIRIEGEDYDRDEVEEDLQTYIEYTAKQYWEDRPEGSEDSEIQYQIVIENEGEKFNASQGSPQGVLTSTRRKIPLSEGNAQLEVWVGNE